ncbi:GNAT family N-acetyltransferase [Gillisia sp. M10.2A]|uniref:GNAT family N-acetyltransferase n=1 Tax=Gillisia lutea TaxID=2909668 RepID=A0ABS9EEI7_9FLAO|nr:GNAT family N-acetyltransferase [Gillisia lutea]MCF4101261.1 GNAT family N-acetyltransferase [Gillisia lutea]
MKIISYDPAYREDFKDLNLAWLKKYFYVEPHDEEVLGNPEKYILSSGGNIFFAKEADTILGTVALMYMEDGVFELTKMAVTPVAQGKKIGQQLMEHTIQYAKQQGYTSLVLFSNRKLENAIYIYSKFGFKEIPIEASPYSRGDIKMELKL